MSPSPPPGSVAHIAEKLLDLPQLAGPRRGELSFDKVRAVVDVATPETALAIRAQAKDCSVRELAELSRSSKGVPQETAQTDYERRSVRFNDTCRTVTAQLPPESYAEVKSRLEARARALPVRRRDSRGTNACATPSSTSYGRTTDGAATASPYVVVAHVPLAALADESSELAGELERDGLISGETVRRHRLRRHRDRRPRRRRRSHDVRGSGPTLSDRCPTPGDHATGSTLPFPAAAPM